MHLVFIDFTFIDFACCENSFTEYLIILRFYLFAASLHLLILKNILCRQRCCGYVLISSDSSPIKVIYSVCDMIA